MWIISLIVALISLVLASFCYLKYETIPELIEKEGELISSDILSSLTEILEPMQKAVSRSMSDRGLKGSQTRQVQKAEALLTQDLVARQDPLIQAGLELFPNFSEYISRNPHLLPQLLPRLQALSQVEGFNLMDLTGKNQTKSRPHPLNREL